MSSGNSGSSGFVPPRPEDLDAILEGYAFLEMLGRGGMGAVYKARQKSLDRLVAIKILPPSLVSDGEEDAFHFAERFQREAKAMARLSHPNIIGVYDFGQAGDGPFYFVMEYIEGCDLHSLIQGGGLTTDHIAGWTSQICEALQYAHARGIVHRDIKPANIMITLEGQVKVADFGLAKLADSGEVQTKLTMTNMAMGTPDYVAPEVLEAGTEVDHRADLYAVGVMLYEMLTGKVPRGAWKPASTQIPGLDPRYDDLIEKAMDADREGRYQQASEISATIYEIATTPPPSANSKRTLLAGPSAPPENARASSSSNLADSLRPVRTVATGSKRSGAGIWIAAVACLAALAVGGFFILKSRESASHSPTTSEPIPVAPSEPEPALKTPEIATLTVPVPLLPDSPPAAPPVAEPASIIPPAAVAITPEPVPAAAVAASAPPVSPQPPPASAPDSSVSAAPAPAPAPSTPVPSDPRLTQLESGFKARLANDADEPYLAAKAALDRSYVANGIARARAAAQGRGSLEEIDALDLEKARVEANEPLPPSDPETLPDSLKTLRKTYREALGKLESERNTKAAPVYDLYLGALEVYVADLTKANDLDRARSVKALRDEVASRKPVPGSPAMQEQNSAAAPPSPPASTGVTVRTGPRPIAEVAETILTLGGTIRILKGGIESDATKVEELPSGRFDLLELRFDRLNSARPPVDDADFAAFAGPETLRWVWIRPGTSLPTDTAFAFLAGNKDLDHLDLEGAARVTDAVLDHVRDSTKLRKLGIQYATDFTGVALAGHPVAKSLVEIDFLGSGITDEGIEAIATCPEVTYLRVSSLAATDEGFAALGGLAKLGTLMVIGTAFGDKSALAVSTIPGITTLELGRTAVTDKGIRAFAGSKQLRSLSLIGCNVSERAVEALRAALPDCKIDGP